MDIPTQSHRGIHRPADWEVVEVRGAAGLDTRVVYRLPDGSHYVWEARRHRKGRGAEQPAGEAARRNHPAAESRHGPRLWVWAPHRITWWLGVVFSIGCALFTLAALTGLIPQAFGGQSSARHVAAWSEWVGALLFTAATYLWLLEGINESDYIGIEPGLKPSQRFRWFDWRPRRLTYMSPLLFLAGSLLWNVETTAALAHTLGWVGRLPITTEVAATGGAVLFLIPSYLQVIEVCHRYVCWQARKISWWIAATFVVGSVAFVVGAAAGLGIYGLSQPATELVRTLGYLIGSILYLLGSYLMVPELTVE